MLHGDNVVARTIYIHPWLILGGLVEFSLQNMVKLDSDEITASKVQSCDT